MSWLKESFAIGYAAFLGLLLLITLWGLAKTLPAGLVDAASWRQLLSDPSLHASALRSLSVASLSTLLAIVIASPVALVMARSQGWHRGFLLIAAMLPLAMPPFLLAATLQAGLGDPTPLAPVFNAGDKLPLLVATYALHFAPVVLLGMTFGLLRLDPGLAESARCHGVANTTTGFRIVLPLLFPPIGLALLVVMIRILGDVGAPLVLGIGDLLATQLLPAPGVHHRNVQMAFMLMLINALLVTAGWRYLTHLPPPMNRSPQRPRSSHPAIWLLGAVICVIGASPLIWMAGHIEWPSLMRPMAATLGAVTSTTGQTAIATAITLTAIGLPMSILTRSEIRSSLLVRTTAALLLIFPTLVIAMGLHAFAGDWLVADLHPTVPPIALVSAATILPLLALIPYLSAHLDTSPTQESLDQARCYGMKLWWVGWRLQLQGKLVLVGSLLCFGAALGFSEISTSLLLGNEPVTHASGVFQQLRDGAEPAVWAASGFGLTLTVYMLIVIGSIFLRSRLAIVGWAVPARYPA